MTTTTSEDVMRPAATLLLLLLWAWFAMTLSHELGHVIGGWATGGKLSVLEIRPWRFPSSQFRVDPQPQITLWAGPIFGSLAPVAVAIAVGRPILWLIAWFCMLANATYLLLGSITGDNQLDSARILAAGTPAWVLWLYVAMTGPVSYVGFRDRCVAVLTRRQGVLTRRAWAISASGLALWVIGQAVVGTQLVP